MSQDQLTLMKDLQSREAELQQADLSPRRRAFIWAAAVIGLIGAILILVIQRGRDEKDLRDLIETAANRHGLDPDLVEAVVYAESKGVPDAASKAAAYGLMQLQVPTASEMAGRAVTRDELFDSELNLELGCKYLVWLAGLLDDDLRLVLMAYNAGIGNVRKWMRKTSDVDRILDEHAFNETRKYVRKVLAFRETIREGG